MAIEHIVLIEFKDGTTDAERAQTQTILTELKDKIPGIEAMRVGLNFSERAGKIELAAAMTMTYRAVLDSYGPHEAHQAAIKQFGGFVENLTVVDFEY